MPLLGLLLSLGCCAGFQGAARRHSLSARPLRMAVNAPSLASMGKYAAKLSAFEPKIEAVNELEEEMEALSIKELRQKTSAFKERLAEGATLDDLLPEAFAVVREASKRALGLRHFDVQLLAGMALHEGLLCEMQTGEGKTLAGTLPAYLNALSGKGVFIVTANDYLARRDAESMGQIHRVLGLTVGLVEAGMDEEERAEAYGCDITYVNNAEIGFDYLRDNLALEPQQVCLTRRPLNYCIVDEADSILIDEARTPLVIAKKAAAPGQKYDAATKLAAALKDSVHYEVDLKGKTVELTDRGYEDAARALGGRDLFDPKDPWAPFIVNAVKAKELFKRDVDYIVKDDEVLIIDSFSGRVLEGRRWSDGLHQSVEAKEGIIVDSQSQVTATVTYQNLFKMFPKLSGMSGTAISSELEFLDVYGLKVLPIPTNLPVARRDYPTVVYKTVPGKFKAVARDIASMKDSGRPVLVGTTSVESSEMLVEALEEQGVEDVAILNAKPEAAKREAAIVAQAGRLGAVTVSTNMAGRGTDIILGGNAGQIARLYVRDVLARRALSADPNELQQIPFLNVDDEEKSDLPCELSEEAVKAVEDAADLVCGSDGLLPPRDPKKDLEEETSAADVEDLVALAAEKAPVKNPQVIAVREAISKVKDEFNAVLSKEREQVMKLGGLYVVGTDLAESPRVDNQLRGRAGRQGDPGTTRFSVSLSDPLMQTFGADRLEGFMETFRVPEDMPIESKQVSKALEKIQQGAEEYFAGIRRQVAQFDEVLQEQRQQLYDIRRNLLSTEGDELKERIDAWFSDTASEICNANAEDSAKVSKVLQQFFPVIAGSTELSEAALGEFVSKGEMPSSAWMRASMRALWKAEFDALLLDAHKVTSLASRRLARRPPPRRWTRSGKSWRRIGALWRPARPDILLSHRYAAREDECFGLVLASFAARGRVAQPNSFLHSTPD
eukprot:scaffold873_cov252-Pinguiococcus_pyrenoidosus.AAC.18